MLSAAIARKLGAFSLEVALELPAGETLALVGESGAGKTTVLRLLAGLLRPERGHITLDGEACFDAARGIDLPSWQRAIGYVAQDYALFPHLSVSENVGFGLGALGWPKRRAAQPVEAILARLGVLDLADRRPDQLSGGQQQRVALARALVLEPRLLLLDEPLSALDLQTRRAVRGELRQILATLTCATLYVTHQAPEAILFGHHIGVLERGRLSQLGAPHDLLRHPRSAYVAEFMGVNLFQGRAEPREGREAGLSRIHTPEGELTVVDAGEAGEVMVALSPREVTLHLQAPAGSAQNVFEGPILELIPEPPFGERVRVAVGSRPALVAEVTRQAIQSLGLREGVRVFAAFKATALVPYR